MTDSRPTPSLAFVCDCDGRMRSWIHRPDGAGENDVAAHMDELLDVGSREKAARWRAAVWAQGMAADWELMLNDEAGGWMARFAGVRDGQRLVALAAPTADDLRRFWDEMTRINNDQANALRALSQQLAGGGGADDRRRSGSAIGLDHFSQLNNELTNAKRSLVRKNAELESVNAELLRVRGLLERNQEELIRANAQLARQAMFDELTGLPNRRSLQAHLDHAWVQSQQQGRPLSLLLMDADHFKQFNDRFGHACGDEVLRQIGAQLRDSSRSSEIAARYGGEEFAVVLEGADAAEAREAGERFRAAVAGADWPKRPVTVSVGAATRTPAMRHAAHLVVAADRAMYQAKNRGRDRVRHVDELSSTYSAA